MEIKEQKTICIKCGTTLKRLMLLAMITDAGAVVSPNPLDCGHEFREEITDEEVEGIIAYTTEDFIKD